MLLVSICDVSSGTLRDVISLRQLVEDACGGAITLLVAPEPSRGQRLDRCAKAREVLKACAALGDEIALFSPDELKPLHNVFSANGSWLAELDWRALDAEHRLRAYRHMLEDSLEVQVEGFASGGDSRASWMSTVLEECGFGWHANARWIDDLDNGRRILEPLRKLLSKTSTSRQPGRGERHRMVTRVTLEPHMARTAVRPYLEALGEVHGPSVSTRKYLQIERRGLPIAGTSDRLAASP